MRVLAFSDLGPPEGSGGVERTLAEIYPRLVAAGRADVCLVTLAGNDLPRREERDGVRIVRARRIPLDRITGLQVAASTDVWRVGMRAAREFKPDVIHAHTLFYHTSLVAAAVARRFRVPLLVTLHVGAVGALPQPYRAMTQLYEGTAGRLLLAGARRVICVSNDVQRHALSLGVPGSKLSVVPNGVDATRYRPGERVGSGPPVVLCVGRLILNKGQHLLLEAVAELRQRGLALRLLLVGDGPSEKQLRQQVARLGIDDVVEFLGHRDDVDSLLAASDIFVRPSLTEGMSLAVLEALAAGLPVVATDVSGSRQLIEDGVNGVVVPPGCSVELANGLRGLVQDPALRKQIGACARERARAYDWSNIAELTAKEMDRVCA